MDMRTRPPTPDPKAFAMRLNAVFEGRRGTGTAWRSYAEMARDLSVAAPTVHGWVHGKYLPAPEKARVIADRLNVPFEWLYFGDGHVIGTKGGFVIIDDETVSDLTTGAQYISSSSFRKVPVVGTASLGMDGYWTDLEYPKGQGDGYFEFPTTDKDAYALQVRGGSMHPAIRSGWYVVIEPNKTPQMGEFVMVKLADGRSTVKEFLWHRDGEYILNAIATNDRLVVAEDEVEAIHHVGGILPPSGRRFT